jgi:hypothetical protein
MVNIKTVEFFQEGRKILSALILSETIIIHTGLVGIDFDFVSSKFFFYFVQGEEEELYRCILSNTG